MPCHAMGRAGLGNITLQYQRIEKIVMKINIITKQINTFFVSLSVNRLFVWTGPSSVHTWIETCTRNLRGTARIETKDTNWSG